MNRWRWVSVWLWIAAAWGLWSTPAVGQNVVGSGGTGEAIDPVEISLPEAAKPVLQFPENQATILSVSGNTSAIREVRDAMRAHVRELIAGWPWRPLHQPLGISGYETHFAHPDHLFLALSLCYPYLEHDEQELVRQFLSDRWRELPPYAERGYDPRVGQPRELYFVPDTLLASDKNVSQSVLGGYASWVASWCAGLDAMVVESWPEIKQRMHPVLAKDYAFDIHSAAYQHDEAQRLNGDAAGLLGYVRLAQQLRDQVAVAAGCHRLRQLLELRVNLERVNPRIVESTSAGSHGLHNVRLARYCDLVPEIGRFVRERDGGVGTRRSAAFRQQHPGWQVAWGDRLLGGENYTNSLTLAQATFAGAAWIERLPTDQLAPWLDIPWCPGDLYFLEKCAAILSAADAEPTDRQPADAADSNDEITCDVVVYGGTSAGVIAAVQAARLGKSVVLVGPDRHLGGLSSGGLGFTDTGDKAVIGGLAREFYHRVWQHYQDPAAWIWQKREEYGNRGQGTAAIDGAQRTMWIFEPHVAEQVFHEMLFDADVEFHADQWLDRATGVEKSGARIVAIRMLSGRTYRARVFLDATYEGDLMAAAGVAYHVGRESRAQYDEKWNGVQVGVLHHRHHFGAVAQPIDPYRVAGDPTSGLLPRISPDPPGEYGAADNKVQAYCFRMCLTNCPENRVPFPKPADYDPAQYELLLRVLQAGWRETFEKFDPIPNHKTDTNNHGPFSTDNIGRNYDYPEADYARRREIVREHESYQQGLMYFLANDSRVPEEVRTAVSEWGLARDEFVDNGHWPHQLYIREARRMVGRYVMTENELLKRRPTPESIGMGSYGMDSHNVQRYVTPEGTVQNEGDIGVGTNGPYQIALGSIQPQPDQCDNLLVPVCVSSSHIAYGSIRMEPVFMILGQSAATLAALAIDADSSVQGVPYGTLRERLLRDGQVLEQP